MRTDLPAPGAAPVSPKATLEAPPVSELTLSACMEDPSAELALAEILAERLGRKIRVLVAGAAGCSALALLSKSCVAEVHAVDLNAAQLNLIDLKRAAVTALSLRDQLALFEADEDVSEGVRFELYDRLKENLSQNARTYWDAHQKQIGYGVGRVGRFENLLFELRQTLEQADLAPLDAPAKALGSMQWNKAFDQHFEKSRIAHSLGSAWVGYTDRNVSQHFAKCMANGLRRFTAAKVDNYFLQSAFNGRFEIGQMPLWLDAAAQERMKTAGLDRLHLHVGSFVGKMAELGEEAPFDLIVMSSIGDSLPFGEMHRLYSQARASIASKGALLARRLTSHRPLARVVQKSFDVDAALSSTFQNSSLSCIHDELVVGFAA
ncbi:MAG: DUF3419 family protein [Deltaproteobacteria bacterium]|nr:DUF3419 family protein [Deltaproteobacteria bacterium]